MFIAKVNNNIVEQIGDYRELFPNTSFTTKGPDADFMAQHHVMPVSVSKSYDPETEQLTPVEPYVENGVVYTVAVQPKEVSE